MNGDNINDYEGNIYWFPLEGVSRKVSARMAFTYTKTNGVRLFREVDVNAFIRGKGGCMINCYCHLRHANRNLSTRAISNAVDRDTGELITDVQAFLEEKYLQSEDYQYDLLLDLHYSAILILLYLAAADGSVRAPERDIISLYCLSQKNFEKLDRVKLDLLIKDLYRPIQSQFHKLVKAQISTTAHFATELFKACEAICKTNKTQHSEQIRALSYIQRQWKQLLVT